MKKYSSIIILIFILFSSTSFGQKPCKKVIISGKVTYRALYKGGARPTPEVLEACCQAQPMSNAKLYLKRNYYSLIKYIITTDSLGNFKKRVKEGEYRVFLKNETDVVKAKEIESGKVDPNNTWVTDPYYVINVVAKKSFRFTLDLVERRDPNEIPKP